MSCAIIGYSSSDYAVDLDARRHVTRYKFTIYKFFICLKEILIPSVALSIIDVEYMVLADAIKEEILLKGLISNLGFPQEKGFHFLRQSECNLFSQGSSPLHLF